MKLSQFVDIFTVTLFDHLRKEGVVETRFGEVVDRYGLIIKTEWRDIILGDYEFNSRIISDATDGTLEVKRVALSSEGIRWVEDVIRVEKIGSFLESNGIDYETPLLEPKKVRPASESDSWTGAQITYVDERVIAELRSTSAELAALANRINYKNEKDERDLKNLARALTSLADMAEPDISLIARILAHPKFRIYEALFAAAATIRGALGL